MDRRILPSILRIFLRKTIFLAYFNIRPKLTLLYILRSVKKVNEICKAAELKFSIRNLLRLSLDFQLLIEFVSHAKRNKIDLVQRVQNDVHFLEWDRADLIDDQLPDFPKLTFSSYKGAEGFFISKGLFSLGSPPTHLRRFSLFRFSHEKDFQKFLAQVLKV